MSMDYLSPQWYIKELSTALHSNKFPDLNIQTPARKITILMSKVDLHGYREVRALLEAGADPNVQDIEGKTALRRIAAKSWSKKGVKLARLLIRYGADPNIQDDYGFTAYIAAVHSRNYPVMEILRKSGADLNISPYQLRYATGPCTLSKSVIDRYKIIVPTEIVGKHNFVFDY